MSQAQLYLYDETNKKWTPATSANLGTGTGSTTGSASAQKQDAILEAIGQEPVNNSLPDVRSLLKSLLNKSETPSYTTTNYSGAIALANTPQDLAVANPNRDRITIQNLDSTDVLLIGIDEDAQTGRSYEIDPRGVGVIEEGEADKRISIMSAKVGLQFVAIGRIR